MTNEIRRYGWFRVYEGVGSHPVWQRAANVVGCSVADTLAVGLWLMIAASKGQPRGSLQDFDEEACASVLRIPAERVTAIYQALKSGKKPWIDHDRIVDWDERNPVREDATSAERKQRWRERKKETWNALGSGTRSNVPGTVMSRTGTRSKDDVTQMSGTVTDRDLDKKIITSSTLVQEQKGASEGSPVKPPHMATRAELDEAVERKRIEREEMLRAKRAAIQTGYAK